MRRLIRTRRSLPSTRTSTEQFVGVSPLGAVLVHTIPRRRLSFIPRLGKQHSFRNAVPSAFCRPKSLVLFSRSLLQILARANSPGDALSVASLVCRRYLLVLLAQLGAFWFACIV
ncbi:hypothetical protein OBBRIDRAFT_520484 [Obba rivulosa]|uniref:Uncharacterized protein n=1 Tax=Obba rivulosa TaxID=1052685 RepID=A0A8E2B4L5_9APHY|nr:hypothetical protein OBBRIDRAFT_520484 [Obba rivulosa]